MQFLYHPDAGMPTLVVEGEAYRYLFKVRRHRTGETVALRNLEDGYLCFYKIERIAKREATLLLERKEARRVMPDRSLHIGWCVVDPKTVEKSLPALNELGVAKLTFVYCARSQKNFRIDPERMRRILINSSQQCGRSELMRLEVLDSVEAYLSLYPESAVLDFGGVFLPCETEIESILIGCEGGFDDEERKLFANRPIYGLDTPIVLRSETAAVTVAAKIL